MPDFTFTSPQGGKYTVSGPDGATPEQAFAILEQHVGAPITIDNVARATASGVPVLGGLINKANAATYAALSPMFPADKTVSQASNFGDRYSENLAAQDAKNASFEAAHPLVAGAAGLAGGVASTLPLAATATGARLLGLGARSLPGQIGAGAISGAGIGSVDALARGSDPVTGALTGLALGGATPALARAAGTIAAPVISNISARINPQGYAASQVARALLESGQTPQQIDAALNAATREGQSMFTAADAMGNAGQRMLSTVARAPGEGRTAVVEAMENRQAGQGRRIASQLAEGFDSPRTASQTEAGMTSARDAAADTAYGDVRDNAAPVDLSPAVAKIDMTLQPGINAIARPPSGLALDSIESALQGIRDRLTDGRSMLTDFTAVQRVRGDLADQVQTAVRAGQGNRARLLGGVLKQIDAAMEDASPGFKAANADFSQASKNIAAVDQGRAAAMRGRTEDTIPQFAGLTPEGQGAYRAGYVDPLIAQTQGAAAGANKSRPLINDAFQVESSAIAPGAAKMQTQLAREQTMFETRQAALGGSKTADNLADQGAMALDPSIIGHVLTGNHMGALRGIAGAVSNGWTGNTPAVRQQVAKILLSRGTLPGSSMQRVLDDAVQRIQMMQRATRAIGRGASVALTDQVNQANR